MLSGCLRVREPYAFCRQRKVRLFEEFLSLMYLLFARLTSAEKEEARVLRLYRAHANTLSTTWLAIQGPHRACPLRYCCCVGGCMYAG